MCPRAPLVGPLHIIPLALLRRATTVLLPSVQATLAAPSFRAQSILVASQLGPSPPPPKVRRPRGRRSVWGKGSHTIKSEIVGGIRARGLSLGSCTKRPPGIGHVLTTIADFRGSGVRDLHWLPRRIRDDSGMTFGIQKSSSFDSNLLQTGSNRSLKGLPPPRQHKK